MPAYAYESETEITVTLPEDKSKWPLVPIILYRLLDAEKTEDTWRYCRWHRWVSIAEIKFSVFPRVNIKSLYPDIQHGLRSSVKGELFDAADWHSCCIPYYPKDGAIILQRLKEHQGHIYAFRMITRPCPTAEMAQMILGANTWRKREEERFTSGEYQALPWVDEEWWTKCARVKDHYAHVSKKNPGKIAFTASVNDGIIARKTLRSPLAYLTEFFSNRYHYECALDVYAIQAWVNKFREMNGNSVEICFAKTEDEIEYVYTHGPASCMAHNASAYATDGYHPTRVYAAGDLQVAYLKEKGADEILARTVIWPEKKSYVRIYAADEGIGYGHELQQELRALGYAEGSLRGAKLLLEYRNGGIVCPYLDSVGNVGVTGSHLVIGGGDYDAASTNGLIAGECCERCAEECAPSDMSTVRIDRHTTEAWCENCRYNYTFFCNLSEECISSDIGGAYQEVQLYGVGSVSLHAIERRPGQYFYCTYLGAYCANADLLGEDDSGALYSIHAMPRYALCSLSDNVYPRSELVVSPITGDLIHPNEEATDTPISNVA